MIQYGKESFLKKDCAFCGVLKDDLMQCEFCPTWMCNCCVNRCKLDGNDVYLCADCKDITDIDANT